MGTGVQGYDEFAEGFLQHAATSAFNALYDRPAVLEVLGSVEGARVLDLGCGPGLYARELTDRGATVTGLDDSGEMIRLARDQAPEATFRVHDLTLPLTWMADESFDLAVMALVIHHLDDRDTVLREAFRVLVPGGRLVVSTHHPMSDWQRLGGSYFDVEAVEEVWLESWGVRYWRQPLERSVAEFTSAGFVVDHLAEPRASDELRDRFPQYYESLSQAPAFIVFSLRKPTVVASGRSAGAAAYRGPE